MLVPPAELDLRIFDLEVLEAQLLVCCVVKRPLLDFGTVRWFVGKDAVSADSARWRGPYAFLALDTDPLHCR